MSDSTAAQKLQEFQEQERLRAEIKARANDLLDKAATQIVLNIGGTEFYTSTITLQAHKGSVFDDLLNGTWKPDAVGRYFLDRDPSLFSLVLNYLRTGKFNWNRVSVPQSLVLEEFAYYGVRLCELQLPQNEIEAIKQWLPGKSFIHLFSGSKEGFSKSIVQQHLSDKGPCLVVITTQEKSAPEYRFGGYAPDGFTFREEDSHNPATFVFSLKNPANAPPSKYGVVRQTGTAYPTLNNKNIRFGSNDALYADIHVYEPGGYVDFNHDPTKTMLDTPGPQYYTGKQSSSTVKDIVVYLVN